MSTHNFEAFSGNSLEIGNVSIDVKGDPVNGGYFARAGNKVIVGYLERDSGCDNPLTSCDGMGAIFTSKRGSGTHTQMQKALGLDRDWQPDYESEAFLKHAAKLSLGALMASPEFVAEVQSQQQLLTEKDVEAFLWHTYLDTDIYSPSRLSEDYPSAPADEETFINVTTWRDARDRGIVGNPFAVSLDVYEHGGVSYSLTGRGMQCRFDTASCGAVWVPDETLEHDLWTDVLAFEGVTVAEKPSLHAWTEPETGRDYGAGIKKTYALVTPAVFTAMQAQTVIGSYPTFSAAKAAALMHLGGTWDSLAALDAARPKALQFAAQACEEYTKWCNGECYAYFVEIWKLVTDEDGDTLGKCVDNDSCTGFIGFTYAEEELQQAMGGFLPKEAGPEAVPA